MAECCCGSGDKIKLLYACSGAANTLAEEIAGGCDCAAG